MKLSPIAIVGAACRLPGDCADLASMWTLLVSGKSTATAVPADRWSRAWYGGPKPRPSRTVSHTGAFLTDIASFDAGYFDYPADEAAVSDPMLRILLELTVEALEDAGLPEDAVRGSSCGTYVGVSAHDYSIIMMRDVETSNASSSKPYYLPNRIAHFLDLRGPSIAVDSACSASLSAVHLAAVALASGECDSALCMGGNVLILPNNAVRMSQLGALSPTGECKPFDSAADGYGRADAAAVLVMKRLDDALAAGDRIYGVIRATGLCHGGRAPLGPWAPRHDQQAALFKSVLADAGLTPADVDYVEAHGTGTQLGDKEEALALSLAYGTGRSSPLPFGSVKRVFNHSEGAAGITGLLKAIAMLKYRGIPATLINTPRTDIPFDTLGIRVADKLEPLDVKGRAPVIGVNSYGVAGAYAHVLVEGPPLAPKTPATEETRNTTPLLLPISAKSPKALAQRVADLKEYATANSSLDIRDVAYTLAKRRTHHEYRASVIAADTTGLSDALGAAVLSGNAAARRVEIVFVFSGTGPQWWGMGRELYAIEPVFRDALDSFDAEWAKIGGWSLVAEMREPENKTKIGSSTRHSTVGQVGLQVALAALWKSWGIVPDVITGHSLGEMAAAHAAGALSLSELAGLTKARCDWQDLIDGMGTMAAVGLSEADTLRYIEKYAPGVDIAGINAPTATTVSGDVDSIVKICEALEKDGVFNRRLRVTVPFHSRFMRRKHDELLALAPALDPKQTHTTFVSAVHGERCSVPLDAAYWLFGFEQPVRFRAAMSAIVASTESPIFLEIGPHPVLATSVEECLQDLRPGKGAPVLTSLRRKEPERTTLLAAAGKLFELGQLPSWDAIGIGHGNVVSLPRYPWQRQEYWDEAASSKRDRLRETTHDLLGDLARDAHSPAKLVATTKISPRLVPFLESHRMDGELLYPGAGFIEGMRAAAAAALESEAVELRDIAVERPLRLDAHTSVDLRTVVDGNDRTVMIFSSGDGGATWVRHASCNYGAAAAHDGARTVADAAPETVIDVDDVYRTKWSAGYHFGPHFRMISRASRRGETSVADLALHEDAAHDRVMARVLVIDGAFQAASLARGPRYSRTLMLPQGVGAMRFHDEIADGARITAAARRSHFGTVLSDVEILGASGKPLATITSFRAAAVPSATGFSWNPKDWLYREELVESPLATAPANADVIVAVIGDSATEASWVRALRTAGAATSWHTRSEAAIAALVDGSRESRRLLVDARPAAHDDETDAAAGFGERSWSAIEVIQQLQKAASGARGVEVVWVTRGEDARSAAFDALACLRRTSEAEQPSVKTKVVQVDRMTLEEQLSAELLSKGTETEVVWRGNERRAVRIVRIDDNDAPTARSSSDAPVALKFTRAGDFFLATQPRRQLAPHEVRIEPKFASLNFRDVMKVLGIYPAEPGDPDASSIGDEAMGVVTEVGAGVRGLATGDRVIVRAAGRCITSELCVPEHFAARIPGSIDDASAAAIPVVFTTAWYGLRTLANLEKGERVLIQSAAGGVGLAALQIARDCGAEVFATAGGEEKRAYLRDLGVEHVFSSKDAEFLQGIRQATAGAGVDVVLNSLAGAQMVQSIAALRDFGRFVELGKRDLYGNTNIGLFPFRRNLSYHALDMAKLWALKPAAGAAVLTSVVDAFAAGRLSSLPTKTFAFSDVRGAFEYFRAGTHVGKIVVDCNGMAKADLPRRAVDTGYRAIVQPSGSYLVTGGLGGMGRVIIEWLAEAGARHIVVLGRSAPSDDAQAFVAALAKRGTRVDLRRGSVSDAAIIRGIVNEVRAEGAPLRGVFHTAGTLKDALLNDVTRDELENVFEPKVAGAWNLHQATREEQLDFFVLFSSSATNGNAGQAVYSMANAFLNWLAHHRQSLGLPAQAIGWGPYMGAGMMSEELVLSRLRAGVAGFTRSEFVDLVDHILPLDAPHVLVRSIDWSKFLADGVPTRYEKLRPEQGSGAQSSSIRDQISAASPEDAVAILTSYLQETTAKIRGLAIERVTPTDTLDTLGFDSLGLVSLVNRIGYDLGVTVALFEVSKDAPLAAFAEKLREKAAGSQAGGSTGAAERPVAVRLSPAQQRFLRCLPDVSASMPVPPLPALYDSDEPFDAGALEETLEIVASRHEALRATFSLDGGEWKQSILPRSAVTILRTTLDPSKDAIEMAVEIGSRPWNISTEPMLRCAIVEQPAARKHSLMVFAHHLAADALSLVALGEEIGVVYQAIRNGRRPDLPPVPTTFGEWIESLAAMSNGGRDERARALIRNVVLQGGRPRTAAELVHSRVLPKKAASPRALITSTAAALLEVLGVPAVALLHGGRTPPGRDLSRTVGPLGLIELVTRDAAPGELDFADAMAFANALAGLPRATAEAFYSSVPLVNVQFLAARSGASSALRRWDVEPATCVIAALTARSARTSLMPATTAFVQLGDATTLRVFSYDPKMDAKAFEVLANRLERT